MNYIIYKTTNKINEKIYIGAHKTENLNDGYQGSGKILKRAIKKHGSESFITETLHSLGSSEEMYLKEKELVNEEFIKRKDTYNIVLGGKGGFGYINSNGLADNTREECLDIGRETQKWLRENDQEWVDAIKEKKKLYFKSPDGVAYRAKSSELIKIWGHLGTIAALSPEARSKRMQTFKNIKHQQGEKHSQFGTMWITNDYENKKIKKTDPIPTGFRKGRKMKIKCA